MNRATIIGHVGKDPEIRHTQDGKAIANFSVATTEKWRDKHSGEQRENTEWHRVVCFNEGLTKVIEQYVKKGTQVLIEGQIQTREWEKDGVKRYSTEIVMKPFNGTLKLLGGGSNSGERNEGSRKEGGSSGGRSYENRRADPGPTHDDGEPYTDDIPF